MKIMRDSSLTSPYVVTRLLEAAQAKGHALCTLVANTSVTQTIQTDMSQRVRLHDEYTIFRQVLSHAHLPTLALSIGGNAPITAYGVLGFAFISAPSLRAALELPNRFPALIGHGFDMHLDVNGPNARYHFTNYSGPADLRTTYVEMSIASFVRACTDILGAAFGLHRVGLKAACSEGRHPLLTEAFGTPVDYNQSTDFFEFPSQLLGNTPRLADALGFQEAVELCKRKHTEYSAERMWISSLKKFLDTNLETNPNIENAARFMNCSARTLRRHLVNYNTCFREILDEVRFDRAKALLKSGLMSNDEIATAIGFSDQPSFGRAFMRWSGQSPKAFRA